MAPALLCYLYPSKLSKYARTHGDNKERSWALVTGASDGIGRGFAHELCSRGFNVVLHGRSSAKLDLVRKDLQSQFPEAKLCTVIADATAFTPQDITNIVDQIKDLHLTVLINNVGGTGVLDANFKTFETHKPAEINGLLSLNVLFPLHLTSALLPLLKQNGPALVMNIGSHGCIGTPFLPVYSGTKGAIHAWNRAFAAEQRANHTGIEVIEILVASVQSQQNQTAKPTFFVPSSRKMAKAALARVGCGETSITGYFPHYLQIKSFALLPANLVDWIMVKMLSPVAGKTERVW